MKPNCDCEWYEDCAFCWEPPAYGFWARSNEEVSRHRARHGHGHIRNKNEARELRRIQAETGLSEHEILTHKKYRKRLSDAQKAQGPGQPRDQRTAKRLLKGVTRELKLAKKHPKVVEAAMQAAKDYDDNRFLRYDGPIVPIMRKLLS